MIRIKFIRTFYPHWGQHSGIHQFIRYLPPENFLVEEKAVPMETKTFLGKKMDARFTRAVKDKGVKAYRLHDGCEELRTFLQCLVKKYDIVHFLDGEHGLLFLPSLLRKAGWLRPKPLLVGMFHQPPHVLEDLINPEIFRQLDYVTVVAPNQEEWFTRYLPKERVRTILHGISTDYFRPAEHKPVSDKLRCLAGGVWLRDYQALFETARLLRDQQEIEFHIIASATLEKPDDLENIVIHRQISDAEYLRLFQESDLLFMPLVTATANNVILEGIACGLPVVSSDLSSVRAYLPGEEAVLVKDNIPKDFAAILSDLSGNPEKRAVMGQKARQRALQLSWENIGREYEIFFTEIGNR